jgi:type IV pilus assembly protein PilY1
MVDAVKGTLLWSAGATGSNANLELARMTHSIPARVTVMDTNSDGYADRMYAGDMGGQIWRFDITNSTATADVDEDNLVAGGVLASLGAHDMATPDTANARRFFYAPDVSAVQEGQRSYFNIAIGSGHRGRPLNRETSDRAYSIRDHIPFRKMTATEYAELNDTVTTNANPITEADLANVTEELNPTIPFDSAGWYLELSTGEKVLAETTTFDGNVFFVTYTGSSEVSTNACMANSTGAGSNLLYVVSAKNAAPVLDLRDTDTGPGEGEEGGEEGEGDNELTLDDRSSDLSQRGIAAGLTFLFPEPNKLVCLSGVEVLNACTDFNSRVKTYWRESSAQ